MENLGYTLAISIGGTNPSHDPSPVVDSTDWGALKTAAASASLFDTAASNHWGSWWTGKSSTEQGRIRDVMDATGV